METEKKGKQKDPVLLPEIVLALCRRRQVAGRMDRGHGDQETLKVSLTPVPFVGLGTGGLETVKTRWTTTTGQSP